jgi:hypothetical protein
MTNGMKQAHETLSEYIEGTISHTNGWFGGLAKSQSHLAALIDEFKPHGFHIVDHFNKVKKDMNKIVLHYTDQRGRTRVWIKSQKGESNE